MSEYYVQCECGRKLDANVDDMLTARVNDLTEALRVTEDNLRCTLDEIREDQPLKMALDLATHHRKRAEHLESALALLTNGMKYSTEVVTIAKAALSGAGTAKEVCPMCQGRGHTIESTYDHTGLIGQKPIPCPDCTASVATMTAKEAK